MVEVFKTDIPDKWQAKRFLDILKEHFPDHKINFDLEDCDKVLRVEGKYGIMERVQLILKGEGFVCELLDG